MRTLRLSSTGKIGSPVVFDVAMIMLLCLPAIGRGGVGVVDGAAGTMKQI